MSRTADAGVRLALIETAARLVAQEGPDALTTRRLASEVGTSTMALYTHFEGMDDLLRAVRLEWFNRLSNHLAEVPQTADPVADLAAVGWAYFFSAVENEHMFRITVVEPLPDPGVATHATEAFGVLVNSVQRCTDEGRLRPGDATARALQIWMMGNGVLVACTAGFITVDDAIDHFYEMARSLLTTFGDDPESAKKSFARGRRRMERQTKSPPPGTPSPRLGHIVATPPA
ncbi:MAG: TetR/AcrR family transcriptional regulator [Actinobacteria bacterium]|nr:TetR/AcrR family transcriptional regulator [Actinomycetota bacterium]